VDETVDARYLCSAVMCCYGGNLFYSSLDSGETVGQTALQMKGWDD
jgi:hypothetical protein